MVDELNLGDLSRPGALDQYLQETDQILEESEESIDPEEKEGKSNAAFAKMRTRLGQQNKLLKTIRDQANQQAASQSQSQSQGRETASAGRSQNPHAERLKKVRARATQVLGHIPNFNDEGDKEAISLLMTEAIAEEKATEIVTKMVRPLQTTNLANALSRDRDLDNDDARAIANELSKLPSEIQGDPQIIQQVVLAYKGRNIDKILTRRSGGDGRKKPGKKGAEEEIEDVDGIFGSQGADTFAAEKPVFSAPADQAGASAASGRKAGTGVGLGEAALEEAEGDKTPPKLSEEDRTLMRKMKIDPSSPGDVEDFLVAKRKKPEKSGLG